MQGLVRAGYDLASGRGREGQGRELAWLARFSGLLPLQLALHLAQPSIAQTPSLNLMAKTGEALRADSDGGGRPGWTGFDAKARKKTSTQKPMEQERQGERWLFRWWSAWSGWPINTPYY